MSYTKKIVFGVGIIFVCMVLANALGYLQRLVLARALTPAEYGLIYAVFAIFGFLSFMQGLGLNDALVKTLPGLKRSQAKSAFLTVVYTQLIATGAILVAALLFSGYLGQHYFKEAIAAPLIMIYAISVFLSPIELTLIAFFQGMGRTEWYGYMNLARAFALFAFTCLLLWLGFGIFAPVISYVLMYVIIPLIQLPFLLRIMPDFRKQPARYDPKLLRRLFVLGLPIVLAATIGVFLTYIDTFFLTIYRTLEEVGLYNVALPTAGLMWFFSNIIYAVMLPVSSEMNARKQLDLLRDGIGQAYLYLLAVLAPFAAILLLFPDLILNALFGAQYIPAATAMQLLVIGGLFYTFANLNMSIIIGLGKPNLMLWGLGAAAAVNVVLDILLIPRYGIEGTAFATLIAFIILFAVNAYVLRSLVRFRLAASRMIRTLLATAVFSIAILELRNIDLPLLPKTALALVIGGTLYLGLLFLLRVLRRDELEQIKRLVFKRE
jgi:O-antigen/teichoic acid export membrane protein